MINAQAAKFVWRNYLHSVILLLTLLFIAGLAWIKSTIFLIILNSLMFGTFMSVAITYGYFFGYTIFVKSEWSREKQFIISTGLLWMFIMLTGIYSYTHRTVTPDVEIPADWMLLLTRYIAIVAAVMQVFAPDMGESLYYGVHRKVMLAGIVVGGLVAAYTMLVAISPAFAAIAAF